jgi:hypothetical protein
MNEPINPPADGNLPRGKKSKQAKSKPIREKDKRPILRGFHVGWWVYVHCPWCDRMHVNGWLREDNASGVTVRYAHGKHSPDAPDCYWISVFRRRDHKEIERARECENRGKMLEKLLEDKGSREAREVQQ